jgi:hypothetical protein
MTPAEYLALARSFAAEATGQVDPPAEAIAYAAAAMCAELERLASPGFSRLPPTRPIRPPKSSPPPAVS